MKWKRVSIRHIPLFGKLWSDTTEHTCSKATTKQQAIRPWSKTDASGQVVMSIKFGAKPVEFEEGKAGIVVGSKDKLPALIDALIAAVRAGELDDLFSQAAKAGVIGKPKPRKAA